MEASSIQRTKGWPPTDQVGRQVPHRFTWVSFARAFPTIVGFFDTVIPEQFWTTEAYADGRRIMAISCPCGEVPTVAEGGVEECECGRCYMNLGESIRVGRPENVTAGVPPGPDSATA